MKLREPRSREPPRTRRHGQRRLEAADRSLRCAVVRLHKATTAKRTSRNALLTDWTKAYGLLKLAAKLLKNEGDPVPFDALFAEAPKKSKPKAPPAAPAP